METFQPSSDKAYQSGASECVDFDFCWADKSHNGVTLVYLSRVTNKKQDSQQ
jgi:hypothetical protein